MTDLDTQAREVAAAVAEALDRETYTRLEAATSRLARVIQNEATIDHARALVFRVVLGMGLDGFESVLVEIERAFAAEARRKGARPRKGRA